MTQLITFEFRMTHVKGPEYDWWVESDERWPRNSRSGPLEAEVARMEASSRYRNISVQDDPHDGHHGTIETSLSGLAARCTVLGCTWSWDYD